MDSHDDRIEFAMQGAYTLRVVMRGTRSIAGTLARWDEIVACVQGRRPERLLVVDSRRGEELIPSEWWTLVQHLAGRGLERVRLAHVKKHGRDHIEYWEIYAREAGWDARAFNDEPTAARWLRYGGDDPGGPHAGTHRLGAH
jgi:hypothetical protein